MFNIDKALKDYNNQLKADGFAPIAQPRRPVYFMLKEYHKTKSLSLAAEIIDSLEKYYVILDRDEFEKLQEIASESQALKEKQKKAAKRTNAKLTPQQLSERNRKAAIARWNNQNNLIKGM